MKKFIFGAFMLVALASCGTKTATTDSDSIVNDTTVVDTVQTKASTDFNDAEMLDTTKVTCTCEID